MPLVRQRGAAHGLVMLCIRCVTGHAPWLPLPPKCPNLTQRTPPAGCRWLTLEGLEGEAGDALWAALGMLPLRHVK